MNIRGEYFFLSHLKIAGNENSNKKGDYLSSVQCMVSAQPKPTFCLSDWNAAVSETWNIDEHDQKQNISVNYIELEVWFRSDTVQDINMHINNNYNFPVSARVTTGAVGSLWKFYAWRFFEDDLRNKASTAHYGQRNRKHKHGRKNNIAPLPMLAVQASLEVQNNLPSASINLRDVRVETTG